MAKATSTTATIGCDLGDKKSELCVLQADGELTRPKAINTTKDGFRKFFHPLAPTHVVVEVGAHSRWVSELLTELGHRVTVANPRKLKLITQSDSKSDKNDAELLARLGRADTVLLNPVTHRGTQAQADLAVPKARDGLVAVRTQLVNHVRSTVKMVGERLPKCEPEAFHRKVADEIPEALKPALLPVLQVLKVVSEQIQEEEAALERISKRYPDVEVVSQVHGVGLLTAMVFLLTLEDKSRFKKSRMVGAFLGLRPRKDQSGDSDRQLRITKAGDPFLRRLLVLSANYILGPHGADSDLRRWGLKLAANGGKNGRKRAKVAAARKLGVLMHRLWVTGEIYEPLRNSKKRPAAAM